MTREEIKEKIADIIDEADLDVSYRGLDMWKEIRIEVADKILAIPELAIVDRGAKVLPVDHHGVENFYDFELGCDYMINEGWVKEIREGK